MIPIPASIAAAIAAACLLLGAWGGHQITHNAWEADMAKQVSDAAKISDQQRTDSSKVDSSYEKDIEHIDVPASGIADQLRGGCVAAVVAAPGMLPVPAEHHRVRHDSTSTASVPHGDPQRSADATAPPHTDDGQPGDVLGHVASEIPSCVANRVQLQRLQELIRANTAR